MNTPPTVSPEEWPMSLLDLFEGRRQLIVYRAFYGPDVTTTAPGTSYPERACLGCSMVADQVSHPHTSTHVTRHSRSFPVPFRPRFAA